MRAVYVTLALLALTGAVWYASHVRDTECWVDGGLRKVGKA